MQFSLGNTQPCPKPRWKSPFPSPSSLLHASMQAPQLTHEMSRLFFLGVTSMKHALSQPLQSLQADIRAVSILSLSETGLIQPKSICMRPAAQTNLHKT